MVFAMVLLAHFTSSVRQGRRKRNYIETHFLKITVCRLCPSMCINCIESVLSADQWPGRKEKRATDPEEDQEASLMPRAFLGGKCVWWDRTKQAGEEQKKETG